MPSVEIITGGAGSGKTSEIVSRLAERYQTDPFTDALVLAPTIRHADQFRRLLVQQCGVAMNLTVETLTTHSRRLLAGAPSMSASLALDELARVARRTVARGGAAAYFAPIAGTAGFVSMLAEAIDNLLEEEISPRRFRDAANKTESKLTRALADIYAAFSAELTQRQLIHPRNLSTEAAQAALKAKKSPDLVMVDGFQRFTAGELRLLGALAERTDMVISFDPHASERSAFDHTRLQQKWPEALLKELTAPDRAAAAITKAEAANPEKHAREIARQIKQKMMDDPTLRASDCAVVLRQGTPYLTMMRRIFSEYEIPLDPAAGMRLSETPLGSWLNKLLNLTDDGWRLKDILDILRSGLVNLEHWNLRDDDLAQIARTARDNQLWSGREAVESLTEQTPTGFADALRDMTELLNGLESDNVGRCARLLDALYGENGWLRDADDLDDETVQSMDQLRRYLAEMSDLRGDEPETYERFRERLNRRLGMPTFTQRTPGGVLLAPMHTMHGLRFRHVAIGGLSEGEFPARRTYEALLSESMRAGLRTAGLEIPPAPRSSEEDLWRSVTSRAEDSISLWRYRINRAGKETTPAAVLYQIDSEIEMAANVITPEQAASTRELAIACAYGWLNGESRRPPPLQETDPWAVVRIAAQVEQARQSFQFAHEYEGLVAGGLVTRLTQAGVTWSPSSLDAYLTCSFQYFGRYVLGLNELADEPDEGDAAMRGKIVHDILNKAIAPLADRNLPLCDDTIETVVDFIDTEGRAIWDGAPEQYGFGQAALWRLEWTRYRDRIVTMLEEQSLFGAPKEGYRVWATEAPLHAEIQTSPPMSIYGYADRIDETPDGFLVIDYKTGDIDNRKRVHKGESAQLPLYAYALSKDERAAGKTVRAAYARLPASSGTESWTLDPGSPDDEMAIQGIVDIVQRVRDSVHHGDFRVNPKPETCPTYCAMKHVCRVNGFSRHKR